jgi:diaminopimelate decarboxylase
MRDLDGLLEQAAGRFGTPAYVYIEDMVAERCAALEAAFGRWFGLSFAVKSNPNPTLLGWLRGRVPYLDVSSGGEFSRAVAAGWDAARLSFTGPGKRDAELQAAIAGGLGELVVESLDEARRADAMARALGLRQDVLVRVAPDRVPKGFGDQMAGRPSPFGVDVEVAPGILAEIMRMEGLRVAGLHIYSGTQCLKPGAICENWRIFMLVFGDLCEAVDLRPERLVFGAGLGIPYHPGDQPVDLGEVVAEIGGELDAFFAHDRFRATKAVLELGRYLVGEAGFFVTRVVAVKESRGSRIVICDGGMNAHLAASGHFGMVLRRAFAMHKVGADPDAPEEKVDLSGPLCTSIDRLGQGVPLPRLEVGDLIAIHASGAYGPTASPVGFISHPAPVEVWASGGQLTQA